MLPIKICKQNGGQWVLSKSSHFVMAVTAKGNPQKYSKPRTNCTETTLSLSSSQTSRFLLVFSLSHSIYFHAFTCSSCLDQTKVKLFWEETCQGWTERDWVENFRMSKEAFNRLCVELSPHILKRDTNFRKAITVHHRVAITLYWLADTAYHGTIANLFGVGKSTVCGILKQVAEVIVRIFLSRYIYVPRSQQEVQEEIDGFESCVWFPQVVGAVDGCDVPIIGPEQSPDDYINWKGFHSLILQGLVDSDYHFLDICVGWPGKVHDARVFKNSPLFALCCARTFLPPNLSVMISGVRVPPLILGDSAYALGEWLMTPYTDRRNLTPDESSFNIKHSMTRVVVENAFGRLKGRFRSISKRLDLNVENSCDVIAACCVLHNFCENLHEFSMTSGSMVSIFMLEFCQVIQTKGRTLMP